MPITSQIRLQQLTGSLSALRPDSPVAKPVMGSASAANLEDVLKYYSQAVANVHGNRDIAAQAPGSFSQDIYSDSDRARLLGQLAVSTGDSMSDNTTSTSLTAATTELTFSSLSVTLNSSEIIKVEGSSGFMLFRCTSGASAGATLVGVEYVADGSSVDQVPSPNAVRRNVSVSSSEWKGVRAPQYVSNQDMEIRTLANDKKITIETNKSTNDGIILSKHQRRWCNSAEGCW